MKLIGIAIGVLAGIALFWFTERKKTDKFKIIRRLTVTNAGKDKPFFELIGSFSLTIENNRIMAIAEAEAEQHIEHTIVSNDWTRWTIENMGRAEMNEYRYEVSFSEEQI